MSQIALSDRIGLRVRPVWLLAPLLVAALAGGAYFAYSRLAGRDYAAGSAGSLTYYTIVPKPLEVRVNKDGEVQAVDNIEVACNVEGTNTITKMVPEGSQVTKGQILVVIDSSEIYQKIEDTTIELERAKSDQTSAQELFEIQKSTNAANLQAAQVALELAQLDLRQYTEGSYPQLEADAKTDLEMATITLKNKREDLVQSRSLFSKGFVTATEVKERELDVTTANNTLRQAQTKLKVLSEYTHVMDLTSKKNALAQAEQKLERTKRENAANLSKAEADVRAKTQSLEVINRRLARYKDQMAACTIKAPADGLVVYNNRDNDRNGGPLAEGSQVRERQVLLRLPDTSSMKVVARINESNVGMLEPGQTATVEVANIDQPLAAKLDKISVLSDSGSRFWNPDLKEYPVDLIIANTPSTLKPGMSARVSILVSRVDQSLSIPLTALYTVGTRRYVFVRDGDQVRPQAVTVGKMNDSEIQLVTGAAANDEVVVLAAGQGKKLLADSGLDSAAPDAPASPSRDRPAGGRKKRPATQDAAA